MKFLEKLNSPLMRKGSYSLEHIKKFHEAFGRPADDLKIIHVAGTNAKGTVTYKMAKMLELSGHKVGMFLSPHLFSWRERVQINGQLISKEDCGKFVEMVQELEKELGTDLTFFEFFTMLAFFHFKQQKVDAAVMEVGLGGRLDATNIIQKPLLSVITSISLDHTKTLGEDVDTICSEKCGIIKSGCPVLIGPQVPLHVAKQFCEERGSPLYISQSRGKDFTEENAMLLRNAADILSRDIYIDPKAVTDVCHNHNLSCRLEPLSAELMARHSRLSSVHFDVGHNPDALVKTLSRYAGMVDLSKTALVYGCKELKDYASCIENMLAVKPAVVYLVQSKAAAYKSGIVKAEKIMQEIGKMKKNVECVGNGDIGETLRECVQREGIEHVLVIGSFTLMRESREFFGVNDPRDD